MNKSLHERYLFYRKNYPWAESRFCWAAAKSEKTMKSSELEVECGASWQVTPVSGVAYTIRCRHCGVMVQSGGTPKCLKNKKPRNN